jgi:hypothetical protein
MAFMRSAKPLVSEAVGQWGGEDVVGVTAHDEGAGGEELVVGNLGGVVAAVVEGPQLGTLDDAVQGHVGGVGDASHCLAPFRRVFSVRLAEEFGEGCGHGGVVDVASPPALHTVSEEHYLREASQHLPQPPDLR